MTMAFNKDARLRGVLIMTYSIKSKNKDNNIWRKLKSMSLQYVDISSY